MDCSRLPDFIDGDLVPEARAQFEQHLATCNTCQNEVEAAMQMWALGAQLSRSPERPQPIPFLPDKPRVRGALTRRTVFAAIAVSAAAVLAVVLLAPHGTSPESQIAAALLPHRTLMERLPFGALD